MQNADVARDLQFNMRLSEDEMRRLDAVAAHHGVNAANLLRMLLKHEADRLGIVTTLTTKPRAPTARKAKR